MKRRKRAGGLRDFHIACVFLGVGAALAILARWRPDMAEGYAVHIYPVLVAVVGRTFGIFPFSVAELGLYLLLISVAVGGIRLLVLAALHGRGSMGTLKRTARRYGRALFLVVAVFFFLYEANCGVNYFRIPFAESAGIRTNTYTAKDLEQVCRKLTEDVVRSYGQVERDRNGIFRMKDGIEKRAVRVMQTLGRTYPQIQGYYPRAKEMWISEILSVQELTGVYSPFTIEANFNGDMADYNLPFTICHELSHMRGYMKEDEANFIAYLACVSSADAEFRYSGSLIGWIYCTNVLYEVDPNAYLKLRSELPEEVNADLRANRSFWAEYEGTTAEVSRKVNDAYLKVNGQEEGVLSYDGMVDLIVAYYR